VPQIGVIAQEIKLAFPEAVSGSEEEGRFLGVNYNAIAAIALQGVKELNTKVNSIFTWFANDKFNVQGDICVDEVCVTKQQFKQMLLNNGSYVQPVQTPTPTPSSSDPVPEPEEVVPTEEDEDMPPPEEIIEEPVVSEVIPEVVPVPIPEPVPEPVV